MHWTVVLRVSLWTMQQTTKHAALRVQDLFDEKLLRKLDYKNCPLSAVLEAGQASVSRN